MIRIYYLDQQTINDALQVKGIEYIHHAILDFEGNIGVLLQDTTQEEHDGLIALALTWWEATPEEIARYDATYFPPPSQPPAFTPLNPIQGVEHRLTHVEDFLAQLYPPH